MNTSLYIDKMVQKIPTIFVIKLCIFNFKKFLEDILHKMEVTLKF